MCFTIEVHLTRKAIEKRFSVDASLLYDFDYNYFYRAFSHPLIPVIPQDNPGKARLMQWGLIPSWAGDWEKATRVRKGTYNARCETLAEKPSFRGPLNRGRCLVIAHGFFEWQEVNGRKVPWYIRLRNDRSFVFAGLYDTWRNPDNGEEIQTFTIITTPANPLLEKIHNTKKRMPVILPEPVEREWIEMDPSLRNLNGLLTPYDENELHAHRVAPSLSRADGNPGEAAIIEPYSRPETGTLF